MQDNIAERSHQHGQRRKTENCSQFAQGHASPSPTTKPQIGFQNL
jgi:hypothetical protein